MNDGRDGHEIPPTNGSGDRHAPGPPDHGSGPRTGPSPHHPSPHHPHPLGPDEQALRRLMHAAVQDLTPAESALDRLHRAVPQRRARRRQAVVGAAAAVLLIGTAVPAFLHVSGSGESSTANSANAGHSENAQGIESGDPDTTSGGGEQSTDVPRSKDPGKATGKGPDGKQHKPGGTGSPDTGGSATGGDGAGHAYEQDVTEPEKPVCDGGQLEVVRATTGAPDAQGKVYGTFRIANKSAAECAVPGQGSMAFQAMGAADETRIKVVEHTSGDPAPGLPDPAKEAHSLVLPPEAAYEVKFAWVPQDTCPSTGASPDPTPTGGEEKPGRGTGGSAVGDGGESGGGKVPGTGTEAVDPATGGTGTQLGTEDRNPAEGKVAVKHTAEPGAPSGEATIPNACAGTIYRTGVLDAP